MNREVAAILVTVIKVNNKTGKNNSNNRDIKSSSVAKRNVNDSRLNPTTLKGLGLGAQSLVVSGLSLVPWAPF